MEMLEAAHVTQCKEMVRASMSMRHMLVVAVVLSLNLEQILDFDRMKIVQNTTK